MSIVDMLGIFVIDNINCHASLHDEDAQGCCPDCCAPCGQVKQLLETDDLNYYIRAGARAIGRNWEWWDEEAEGVNVDWLRSRWGCQSFPPCEEEGKDVAEGSGSEEV